MNYGSKTICRPLVRDDRGPPEGAVLSNCPYCERPCWIMPEEKNIDKKDTTEACTECAIKRAFNQTEMDNRRVTANR